MHRRSLGRARKRIAQAAEVQAIRHGRHDSLGGPDPLEVLLSSERAAMLRRALQMMPTRDAELLIMKHVDDCSYKEIASRLGVTVPVVEMRLFRARQKMRSLAEDAFASAGAVCSVIDPSGETGCRQWYAGVKKFWEIAPQLK
jgi:RNA polymerase sigma-70 factor (ECF subfamily)